MKGFKLILVGLVMLWACDKEESVLDPKLITGTWKLENVTFNGIDGGAINDWVSTSAILQVDDNKHYYRNYVGGEWNINNRKLILDPGDRLPEFYWEYEILELTKETLKVKILLSETQYCCDFDQFENDDVLVIIETYKKSE
ncbi:hypothetical protein GCM10009122_31430 [Fulvivirga kasyanovii]|uniref:Lipocalin-like domain-containing protein n=1 Tax=Fulvivirga kasyanovii TaxID=396812 RepID=A0ABW9RSV5_9BACT|nr:lipocalin family protein [Fulvivirga kasyanovii]MTI26801.1 hypothetical protein [Fulvivirga kasyanovii]